jgi:hypothetical protein
VGLVGSFFLFVADFRVWLFLVWSQRLLSETRAFSGIARFKLLSVGRVASAHGDLCNEHTKGQQRAVSSTFRVLTQAQYQTRAVAAKKSHLEAVAKILSDWRPL